MKVELVLSASIAFIFSLGLNSWSFADWGRIVAGTAILFSMMAVSGLFLESTQV